MRILIHMGDPFTDNSPNSKRMMTFADALTKNGHHVSVLSPKCKTDKESETVKIICCPMLSPQNKSALGRMVSQLSYGVTSFFRSAKAGKTDIVLTSTPPALISPAGWLIAKFRRAALVYDVRDIWPDVAIEMGSFQKGSVYEKGFRRVRDFMLKRSDLVTAVSPGKVKKLKDYAGNKDVVYITNGFDNRFLDNTEDPDVVQKYGLNSGFTCVYVGKLGLAQGLSGLLDLAEQVRSELPLVRFLLFGSGVEELTLKKQVEERKIQNVFFGGTIPNDQVYTVLKNAGVCYVPLVNENLTDSIPTKLYEALGVGCPVLLSACGDSAAILHETGLGISVTPNDPAALREAFMTIYNKTDWDAERKRAFDLMTAKYSRQSAAEKLNEVLCDRFG